jgi:hypothetical protein
MNKYANSFSSLFLTMASLAAQAQYLGPQSAAPIQEQEVAASPRWPIAVRSVVRVLQRACFVPSRSGKSGQPAPCSGAVM